MTKQQKRKVEWSFDFESIGDRISQFVTDRVGEEVEVEYYEHFEPRDGATSARIDIGFPVGKASLSALEPDSGNLFEARIHTIGEHDYEVSGGDERHIALRQRGRIPHGIARIIGNDQDLSWDIRLARDIPCRLRLSGGIGECAIDLSHLQMDAIELETGIGTVDLILPAQHSAFSARVTGGVGKTDIAIPAGCAGRLVIKGGVGETTIGVSPESAIRLVANTGLGKVKLPERLIRHGDHRDFMSTKGVWETEGFDSAEQQTTIEFDGGIGSFQIKTFEVL